MRNNLLDWRYEQRRTAQRVLPFMYLGPTKVARDAEFLVKEGITLVVGVKGRIGGKGGGERKMIVERSVGKGMESAVFDTCGGQDMIRCFEGAVGVVNEHLEGRWRSRGEGDVPTLMAEEEDEEEDEVLLPGKVLVYCETGNDRSAAVVAAYILAMFDMDMVKVIQIVQAQRFCASFDDATRQLLETWEEMLRARRDVIIGSADRKERITVPRREDQDPGRILQMRNFAPNRSSKRTFDQADEGAMDIDVLAGDAWEAGGREGRAPFQDT